MRSILAPPISGEEIFFLDIIKFAAGLEATEILQGVAITYRDFINGSIDGNEQIEKDHRLLKGLKKRGIRINSETTGARLNRRRNYDLDPLIKKDIGSYAGMESIETIILFSGDKHFAQTLAEAKEKGKEIIVVSGKDHLAPRLAAVADKHFILEEIIEALAAV